MQVLNAILLVNLFHNLINTYIQRRRYGKEQQQREEELKAKEAEFLRGNPLLNNPTSFNVKRRFKGSFQRFETTSFSTIIGLLKSNVNFCSPLDLLIAGMFLPN